MKYGMITYHTKHICLNIKIHHSPVKKGILKMLKNCNTNVTIIIWQYKIDTEEIMKALFYLMLLSYNQNYDKMALILMHLWS